MASAEVDPYLDPTTGLLRNKVGAGTQAELDQAEGDLTFARLVEIIDDPPAPTGDLTELRAIHRHLFQDVYDWAGEVRTIDIRKGTGEPFMPAAMVERGAGFAAEQLQHDDQLRGMGRARFVDRLAHHYDQFNYVHPFREGNGRSQRVLWSRVARDAGWQLDWTSVHGPALDQASRTARTGHDLGPLRAMFDTITSEAAPKQHGPAWRAAEIARAGFPPRGSTGLAADPGRMRPPRDWFSGRRPPGAER